MLNLSNVANKTFKKVLQNKKTAIIFPQIFFKKF